MEQGCLREGQRPKIVVFTGEGKGKTTAALGMAVLAAAKGQKACVIQFFKGSGFTGELFAQQYLADFLTITQFGYGCANSSAIREGTMICSKCGQCFRHNRDPQVTYGQQALAFAVKVVEDEQLAMLVLDEISHGMNHGLVVEAEVIQLITKSAPSLTVVLTGRNMPEQLLDLAHQVNYLKAVKHPMDQGIDARRGSEY
jgi:cob(I)alamin adenosyltransferase